MSLKSLAGIGLIFAALALWHGMKSTTSLWPGVALFCLSGLLACAAACIEAAAESAKHEAELDANERDEAIRQGASRAAVNAVSVSFENIDRRLDHLEKKDALNALG